MNQQIKQKPKYYKIMKKKNTRKIYEKYFKEDYIKRCGQKHSLSYCKNLYEVYTETK
jgi:hypothetical protein